MKGLMVERSSIQQMVERAKGGERRAFDDLTAAFSDRLRDSVRSWTRFQLGRRLDPEEVLQETFVRAFRAVGSFEWRDDDSFFRWLCGIAKRALAQLAEDAHRGERTKTLESLAETGPSSSKVLRREERLERLEAGLRGLAPDYRQVLLLSRIEGLTAPQIAERMNRSPNAVRHLIVRALRELRAKFGETESLSLPRRGLRPGEKGDGQ